MNKRLAIFSIAALSLLPFAGCSKVDQVKEGKFLAYSTTTIGKAFDASFGNVEIDFDAGLVKKDGEMVTLTAMEYKLLVYLVTNKNRVIPKNEIFDNVWEDSFVSEGTLNVHMRHLREKLEENPNSPTYLKTVRGMGIMFKE